MIFNIILNIVIVLLVIFLSINLFLIIFSLGYVIQEKYPNKKSMIDKLELFYRDFWRKIIE